MKNLHPRLTGKSHIIWDWNGTLLDDVHITSRAIAAVMTEKGLPPITLESHREKFRFPITEYYQDLGFNLETLSFEHLAERYWHHFQSGLKTCTLFNGCVEFLEETRTSGISHSILSACNQDLLLRHVQAQGIAHHFDHIFGLDNHLAASKVDRGKRLMETLQTNPENLILIGDTDHDLEVGQALGVDVLLIADGHQSYERLAAAHTNVLESRY